MDMNLLKDITTDEYGTAFDLVSVLALAGFVIGMALFVISCFKPINFHLFEYAGGFSTMLVTTTAAMRVKPPAQPPSA